MDSNMEKLHVHNVILPEEVARKRFDAIDVMHRNI